MSCAARSKAQMKAHVPGAAWRALSGLQPVQSWVEQWAVSLAALRAPLVSQVIGTATTITVTVAATAASLQSRVANRLDLPSLTAPTAAALNRATPSRPKAVASDRSG